MSNRKGGRYDRGGNWWASSPKERPRWRRLIENAFVYGGAVALVIGFFALSYWINSHSTAYRDDPHHDSRDDARFR